MSHFVTPRQARAIAVLVGGGTVEKAAQAAGVTRRTVLRWRALPHFAEAVKNARSEAFEQTLAAIQAGTGEAVEVCRRQLRARKPGGAHKLAAARALLHVGLKAHEQLGLEDRITAIEARVGL